MWLHWDFFWLDFCKKLRIPTFKIQNNKNKTPFSHTTFYFSFSQLFWQDKFLSHWIRVHRRWMNSWVQYQQILYISTSEYKTPLSMRVFKELFEKLKVKLHMPEVQSLICECPLPHSFTFEKNSGFDSAYQKIPGGISLLTGFNNLTPWSLCNQCVKTCTHYNHCLQHRKYEVIMLQMGVTVWEAKICLNPCISV